MFSMKQSVAIPAHAIQSIRVELSAIEQAISRLRENLDDIAALSLSASDGTGTTTTGAQAYVEIAVPDEPANEHAADEPEPIDEIPAVGVATADAASDEKHSGALEVETVDTASDPVAAVITGDREAAALTLEQTVDMETADVPAAVSVEVMALKIVPLVRATSSEILVVEPASPRAPDVTRTELRGKNLDAATISNGKSASLYPLATATGVLTLVAAVALTRPEVQLLIAQFFPRF